MLARISNRDRMRSPTAERLTRREFIKLGGLGSGALLLPCTQTRSIPAFPEAEKLGRITSDGINVRSEPDLAAPVLETLLADEVVVWQTEVVGNHPYRINQRWVETPLGYIWAGNVQPVMNLPNSPVNLLPELSEGHGMWVEVTIPWVDIILDNPPARSPWLKENLTPRLYYSQILWVDEISQDNSTGKTFYRINERYGYGDIFHAEAEAFRPLEEADLSPIRPEIEDKRVVVNLTDQSLSCFEQGREVYFCRISSGAKFDAEGNPVEKWATPVGAHPIWRKVVSLHMSGGTTGGGYDLPGIGWSTLFVGNGVAIHSTFWHNNFGTPMSHGCVNAQPDDAKWVFRWTSPLVTSDPGDVTVSMPGGTKVEVIEL
jgi:hypothetical protein